MICDWAGCAGPFYVRPTIGRLDSLTNLLLEPALFLYSYVRKDAVPSAQIDGTESTLSDLLLFGLQEAPGAPADDVVEVSSYVAALEHGLKRVREGFIHDDPKHTPVLIKAALAHVQFEIIHPFLNGNGRVPPAHHAALLVGGIAQRAASVSEPLLQAASGNVLLQREDSA